MSYYGTPISPTLVSLPSDAAANIDEVQTQVAAKLNRSGDVLTNTTTASTPALASGSLQVAPVRYVDQSIAASGALLMALQNGII